MKKKKVFDKEYILKFEKQNRFLKKINSYIELTSNFVKNSAMVGILLFYASLHILDKTLINVNLHVNKTSLYIRDEGNLSRLLENEKKKLGLEGKLIHASFSDTSETSFCKKEKDGSYSIFLAPRQHSLGILKHELYHIEDGHVEKPRNVLEYIFYYEPQATIYSLTGIKL